MANTIKMRKVTVLPGTLEPSCCYFVKPASGEILTLVVTDSAGAVSYQTPNSDNVGALIDAMVFDAGGLFVASKIPPVPGSEPYVIAQPPGGAAIASSQRLFYDPSTDFLREGLGGISTSIAKSRFQERLAGYDHIMFWEPPGDSATSTTAAAPSVRSLGSLGMDNLTVVGTVTARATGSTNKVLYQRRIGIVSAATAPSLCGYRLPNAQMLMGSTANPNIGGFSWKHRFGISDTAAVQAAARTCIGVSSSVAAPANVSPATLTNHIGVGHDAAGTNFMIYYGGSAAQTPIDTGIPVAVLSTQALYEFGLYSAPGSDSVQCYLKRFGASPASFYTTLTGVRGTALPGATTLLTPLNAWRTNNTVAVAASIDVCRFYCRQFYSYN